VAVLAVAELQEDGSMNITRLIKHLLHFPWLVHRKFPPTALNKIEQAIKSSENQHSAEIRFAVESSLSFSELLQNTSCFDRGVEVFSELRIWDTEYNNGVLIFLLLADRNVEIIADRGLNSKIAKDEWQQICKLMEQSFKKNEFEAGVLIGMDEITKKLIQHYPAENNNIDELSNKPVIL
jgi:uncharacterized membrane protein